MRDHIATLVRVVEAAQQIRGGIHVEQSQQFEVVGDHFALRCWDFDEAVADLTDDWADKLRALIDAAGMVLSNQVTAEALVNQDIARVQAPAAIKAKANLKLALDALGKGTNE